MFSIPQRFLRVQKHPDKILPEISTVDGIEEDGPTYQSQEMHHSMRPKEKLRNEMPGPYIVDLGHQTLGRRFRTLPLHCVYEQSLMCTLPVVLHDAAKARIGAVRLVPGKHSTFNFPHDPKYF